MISPEFDAQGYPTDATLKAIRDWPRSDYADLIEFVKAVWHEDGVFTFGVAKNTWSLVTGGQSGNENIIGALAENFEFWTLCWYESKRGGRYTFILDGL